MAEEGADRTATLLAAAFDRILDLSAAVVFVDEVEDLASDRHEERRVSPSVTNEFLKQIPRLREAPEHLLVCATNWVGRLDPAFLRPGRSTTCSLSARRTLPRGRPSGDGTARR